MTVEFDNKWRVIEPAIYKNQFAATQLPLEIALPALPKGAYALTVVLGTEMKSIQFIR